MSVCHHFLKAQEERYRSHNCNQYFFLFSYGSALALCYIQIQANKVMKRYTRSDNLIKYGYTFVNSAWICAHCYYKLYLAFNYPMSRSFGSVKKKHKDSNNFYQVMKNFTKVWELLLQCGITYDDSTGKARNWDDSNCHVVELGRYFDMRCSCSIINK